MPPVDDRTLYRSYQKPNAANTLADDVARLRAALDAIDDDIAPYIKKDVICATTANITLSGTQTIDGIAVVAGNRVLVKNQAAPAENGVYIVSATAWSRAADMNTADASSNAVVGVERGTVNGGKIWSNSFKATDTLGTTAMVWGDIRTVGNAATFNNGGAGATSGTTFDGSSAVTISYNTIGAAASSHTHGNITNAGAIGSTANLPIITTTSGVLTTGSFGTAVNTFCQGNDSRLSDTRNTTNSLTFNNGGAGAASGSTFNGSSAITVSYNTLGALPSILAQQGGKTYVTHDFNTYPNLYDVTFVNPTGSTNLPTGMSSVMSYRFVMGAGDTTARGFDLVGAAEGSGNLYIRERSLGVWSRLLHSNNYNSYSPTLTGTGASGNWGINVTGSSASCTGNAATATTATNFNGVSSVTRSASHRANVNITGGGTLTVSAAADVLWGSRFIVISNTRGASFSTNGYFDIACPLSGTITGVGGAANKTATAAGIPLGAWEAIYYILPIGSASTSLAANFRVASYVADLDIPHDWTLVCLRNGDDGLFYFPNGIRLPLNSSLATGTYDAFRALVADTATNSPSLTGTGASGTWGISISGNSATTSGCTFPNDATSKDDITTRTDSGFYQSSTGTTAEGWPLNDTNWQHLIACTHNNDANYYSMQIGASFFSQNWYFRNTNGSGTTGWSTMLHSGNYNSYAPTLTGTGASGTWGISITGNAATITNQGTAATRNITTSTSNPSGGVDGDIWIKYAA